MLFRYIVILALVFTVSGCITNTDISPDKRVPESDGVVVLRIASNKVGFERYFKYWKSVRIESADVSGGSDEYSIGFTPIDGNRSAVYIGNLPPGHYRIKTLYSEPCGTLCVNDTLYVARSFGEFDVRAGRLTYLGHFVYESAGSSRAVIAHEIHPDFNDIRQQLIQQYPGIRKYMNKVPLYWDTATVSKNMVSQYNSIRSHSKGLTGPIEIASGEILFGSLFGILRRWQPGTVPQAIDTGTNRSIEALLEIKPASWLIGGDGKTLRMTDDSGKSWRALNPDIPYGVILNLEKGLHDDVVLTLLSGNSVYVFAGRISDRKWKKLYQRELESDYWTGSETARPGSFRYQDKLITVLPSKKGVVVDLGTYAVRDFELPGGMSDFTVTRDGLLRCMCKTFFTAHAYESRDFGKTWTDSVDDIYMRLPVFLNKSYGVSARTPLLTEKTNIVITTNGGKVWKSVHTGKQAIYQFLFANNGRRIIGTNKYDTIIYSDDNGKTWKDGY
ncbi:MAG: hypothetical protein BMS9Abin26_0357 [Gammaproteobacteria bacterium]|nr:MAG: hypothetical protein BMS9Abin26_0357 [Gammaproteobacteria bacterium]